MQLHLSCDRRAGLVLMQLAERVGVEPTRDVRRLSTVLKTVRPTGERFLSDVPELCGFVFMGVSSRLVVYQTGDV